jgi:hypothetical protein
MKIKTTLTCCVAILVLSSCQSSSRYHKGEISDCSSVFESRGAYGQKAVNKGNKNSQTYKTEEEKIAAEKAESEKPATVCKVLEIKIDSKNSCEIVGSDKIDNLATVLNENKTNKIIFITPEDKLRDLKKFAENYLMASGIDVKKYFDSELFKNLNFPYKGVRCKVSGKEIVAWSGKKQLIITIGN